jgi:divalent metal cation (Fe/Co/Zn/Cd) transporter
MTKRDADLRSAIRASWASICWGLGAGVAAVTVGLVANTLSLLAYGLDGLVDCTASGVILLDLRVEVHGGQSPVHRRAERTVGLALLLIGAVVSVQSVRGLRSGHGPDPSSFGIAIAFASVVVLPPLAVWKIRVSRRLNSTALQGDGILTAAGAALAAMTLSGMLLDRKLGWWWADPTAAIGIGVFLIVAGIFTLRDGGRHART